jgi:hypothetical protein
MLRIMGVLSLSILLQAVAQPALSQALPPCAGDIVTVRCVAVKPPATLEQY